MTMCWAACQLVLGEISPKLLTNHSENALFPAAGAFSSEAQWPGKVVLNRRETKLRTDLQTCKNVLTDYDTVTGKRAL